MNPLAISLKGADSTWLLAWHLATEMTFCCGSREAHLHVACSELRSDTVLSSVTLCFNHWELELLFDA